MLRQLHAEIARSVLGVASVGDGDARVRGAAAEALKSLGEEKKDSSSDKDESRLIHTVRGTGYVLRES